MILTTAEEEKKTRFELGRVVPRVADNEVGINRSAICIRNRIGAPVEDDAFPRT